MKKIKLQTLRVVFDVLKMKEFKFTSNFYSRVMSIMNQPRRQRREVDDVRVIEKILRSLTSKFN